MTKSWQKNIGEELNFWRAWLETSGLDYPQDYKFRLDPCAEIQPIIGEFIITGDELILDVGAGPLTVLGKRWNGAKLKITACDALADKYNALLNKVRIDPIIRTDKCEMEKLSELYPHASFDIVFAQNCVDHSYDPLKAIIQMLKVCNYGGYVILRHEVNEGENEGYRGLHQWNFFLDGCCFMIGTRDGAIINVDESLPHSHITLESSIESGYITNIFHKL
jgi:SAM-dependent methyltransferase